MRYGFADERVRAGHVGHILGCVRNQVNEDELLCARGIGLECSQCLINPAVIGQVTFWLTPQKSACRKCRQSERRLNLGIFGLSYTFQLSQAPFSCSNRGRIRPAIGHSNCGAARYLTVSPYK